MKIVKVQQFSTAINTSSHPRYVPIEAPRGNIIADDGSLLAISMPLYDVHLDMSVMDRDSFSNNVAELSLLLANLFGDNWYLGLSIPQLLSSELNLMDDDFARIYDTTTINGKLASHIFVIGAYKYVINPTLTLEPNFFFKYVSGAKGQIDLGVKTEYKNLLWAGINYKMNNKLSPMAALLGYNINDRFNIGYSYGLPSSSTSVYQSGSHEFMLGIKLPN